MKKLLHSQWFWTLLVLAFFAVNTFVLGVYLMRQYSLEASTIVYLVFRLIGYVGLAYALEAFCSRKRFQAISQVMFVAFIDQVIFKYFGFKQMLQIEEFAKTLPEAALSNQNLFYGLASGFLFFAPFVIFLALLGYHLPKLKSEWKNTPKT